MEYTVHIYWKKGIIEGERNAAIDGVNTFVDILKKTQAQNMPHDKVKLCGIDPEFEAFVQNLPKVRAFTNAREICKRLNQMLPEFSIGVYITDEPITDGENYMVGLTSSNHITVSTFHFRKLSPSSERFTSIKLCMMHELGHAHGMVGMNGRVNSVSSSGNHCTDPLCLMQQPSGNFASLIQRHHDDWFCPLCLEDARLRKLRYDTKERQKNREKRLPNLAMAAFEPTPNLHQRSNEPSTWRSLPPRRAKT